MYCLYACVHAAAFLVFSRLVAVVEAMAKSSGRGMARQLWRREDRSVVALFSHLLLSLLAYNLEYK